MTRSFLRTLVPPAALLAGLVAIAAAPSRASAQSTAEVDSVSGKGKGIVGGALLGGEIVCMPMGIAGLKPWWPYLVFGGLGSVGGAVGGWAVEQANPPAEAPLYMLAGGLALIIPTLVVSLNATTKSQYKDDSTTEPSKTAPPAQPGAPASPAEGTSITVTKTSDARDHLRHRRLQTTLFAIDTEGLGLGVPAIDIRPSYTPVEISQYHLEQQTEVRIPVFSASF